MSPTDDIHNVFLRVLVAVTFLLGCCGIGRSMTTMRLQENTNVSSITPLSTNDSIMQEVGFIVNPNSRLSRHNRKRIETRLKHLPHRIVRRDTTRYFLQTALAVAYYEFNKKDYKSALAYVNEFNDNVMPREFWKNFFKYSAVGISAGSSIREKGKIKGKTDPNSWWTPLKFETEISFQRNEMNFLDNFIDDIPLDGELFIYKDLLQSYHDLDGKLVWLNAYSKTPGLFEKCMTQGRQDILNAIYEIWGVTRDDFQFNRQNNQIAFVDNTLKPNTAFLASITKLRINPHILDSLDPEWNRNQVDSLLSVGLKDSISQPLYSLLKLTYNRHNFMGVIDICKQYENVCPNNTRLSLYNHWGLAESFTGKFDSALKHFDEALKYSHSQELTLVLMNNKACTLGEAGRYNDAIELFNSIRDFQKTPFDHFCWNDNLGYIYSYIDPSAALSYYNNAEHYLDGGVLYPERKVRHFCRKARVLAQNPFLQREAIESALQYTRTEMPDTISLGMANSELGAYYNSIKDFKNAERCFSIAEKCFRKLVPEDRRVSYLRLLRSRNLRDMGKLPESLSILKDLYVMQINLLGLTHVELLSTLGELCIILCDMNAPIEDISLFYHQYISIREQYPQHKGQCEDLKLGIKYAKTSGNIDEAIRISLQSLTAEISAIDKIRIAEQLEGLIRNTANYSKTMSGLIDNLKRYIIQSLLMVDSHDASAVSQPLASILNGAVSQLGDYDTDCENELTLSLFRKGLLFSTRNAVESLLSSNRHTRARLKKLNEMRDELNFAIAFADEGKISTLIPAISSLEREVNNYAISDKRIYSEIDKSIKQVMGRLSESDVAIEFIRYQSDKGTRYGAFVMRRNTPAIFIKLFSENDGDIDGKKVWSKLLPYLSEDGNTYFSTDGKLSSIGIEYLSPDGGEMICKRYNLHRVFHLADIGNPTYLGKRPILVGVSDHNSPVGEGETLERGTWTDLPNVKYEMNIIEHQLERLTPVVYFNDDARENAIKRLNGSNTSVLHFSTHGFFLGSDSLQYATEHPEHFDYHIANRTLRANRTELTGLVLRCGNVSWRTPEILDDEDDLLTAAEVESMKFPNLKLVVLSACKTGLGEIDSEGVWGLQRAFRIAGAKSLICSLNKVDDYWTAQFMDAFYEHASKGNTIYDSFHTAQRWLRRELPDNPEVWSAFILIE